MDGFKSLPKMQAFKEGGNVKAKAYCGGGKAYKKAGGEVDKADIKQDKAIVKKAFAMHDKQEHGGEKTDLSTLKKGGRTKKATGTVKKFAKGGDISGSKGPSGEKDAIKKVAPTGNKKAKAPSKAAAKANFKGSDVAKEKSKSSGDAVALVKSKQSGKKAAAPSGAKGGPNKYKTGGKVKKFAEGKSVDVKDPQALVDKIAREENEADARIIPDAARAVKDTVVKGYNAIKDKIIGPQGTPTPKKKGGKIKCMADGGLTDAEKSWMGGADVTDPFILARMRQAVPAAVKPQGSYIPNANAAMDNRDMGATHGSIDDESQWGNVSPAAAAFNRNIPGAGPVAAAPSAAVRQVARPVVRPAPVIEDESGRGVVTPAQQEFNRSIPGSGNAPYVSIPSRAAGMQQYRSDAVSPAEQFFKWLSSNQSQRNRRG